MRGRTLKLIAEASGAGFQATDELRTWVRALQLNNTPHERIAECLNISLAVLRLNFRRELALAEAEITAQAALNVMKIASMVEQHPVAALKANEMILRPRLAAWREPKQEAAQRDVKRVDHMSLDEVEEELRRVRQELAGGPGAAAGPQGEDPASEAEPG